MANELVKVNFHGQDIDCMREERGVFSSLRRLCENIGLDADTQAKKLRDKPWATTVLMTVVADDGKQREMLMLPDDAIAGAL